MIQNGSRRKMLDPDSAVSRSERSSGLVTNEVGRNGGAFASYGEEGRKWLGSARVRSRSREAKTRPSAGGRGVHRRERWRARCAPSKATKTETVRTGGVVRWRNEPDFPRMNEVALRSSLESTGTEFNYESGGGQGVRLRKSKRDTGKK